MSARRRRVVRGAAAAVALLVLWVAISSALVERRLRDSLAWQPTRLEVATSGDAAGAAPDRAAQIDWTTAAVLPDARGRRRVPVALETLPPVLVDAVLLLEDRRFFEHHGVDAWRIGGAALANLRAGGIAEGGSTITQQLVRTVALSRERTLARKLREAAGALLVDARFDKRTLLAAYLNEVYLAQDGAIAVHGVEAASRHVFGKPASVLGVAEAALLAGMIQAPSRYAPQRHPAAARGRRGQVLARLEAAGRISAAEAAAAAHAPLPAAHDGTPRRGGHALEFTRRWLAAALGADALARDGLAVRTTLDWRMQALAEDAVARGLARIEAQRPALAGADDPVQAALVALDPRSGALRVLVGGRDFDRAPYDRAATARRQPGSVFKPFVLLAALARRGERPPRFTLASRLEDMPLRVPLPLGDAWEPQNPDHQFRGDVTLRYAIEQSLNVPLARLGLAVGLERVVAVAHGLGVAGRLAPVPSLSLGTSETSLLSLVRAYGALAAGGVLAPLRVAGEVRGRDGRARAIETPAPRPAVSAAEAWIVTSALQGAANRGSAAPLRRLGFHGDVAMKTGTSDGFRDAWAVGYTPELAVGVWVGTDAGRSIGQSGGEAALPIAAEFLVTALGPRGRTVFQPPPGLERAGVEVPFGAFCLPSVEVFLAGTAPGSTCRSGRAFSLTRRPLP